MKVLALRSFNSVFVISNRRERSLNRSSFYCCYLSSFGIVASSKAGGRDGWALISMKVLCIISAAL